MSENELPKLYCRCGVIQYENGVHPSCEDRAEMVRRCNEWDALQEQVKHWEGEVEAYAGEVERLQAEVERLIAEREGLQQLIDTDLDPTIARLREYQSRINNRHRIARMEGYRDAIEKIAYWRQHYKDPATRAEWMESVARTALADKPASEPKPPVKSTEQWRPNYR